MVAFATGCSGESVPVADNEEVVATEMQRTPTVTFFSTDDSVVLSEDAPAKEIEDYPYYYKEDNKEKEKFKTCSYDRCNKCKDNEEDYALSLI